MSPHPAPPRFILSFTLLALLLLPTLSHPSPGIRVSTPDRHLSGRPTAPEPRNRRPTHKLPFVLRPPHAPSKPVPPAPLTRPAAPKQPKPVDFGCTRREALVTLQCLCRIATRTDSVLPLGAVRCQKAIKAMRPEERMAKPCSVVAGPKTLSVPFVHDRALRIVAKCIPGGDMKSVLRQNSGPDPNVVQQYINLLQSLQSIVNEIFRPSNDVRMIILKKPPQKEKSLRLMQYNDIQSP